MKTFQAFVFALLICASTNVGAIAYNPKQFPGKGNREAYRASLPAANNGSKFLDEGKFNEAIENYDKAIAIYPFDAGFYCNRGSAYVGLKKHSEAIASFRKGAQLAPDWSYNFNNLADELRITKDFTGAEAAAKTAIQLSPDDPVPVLTLAETYIDMGKPANAKVQIDKASRMPKSANDQFIKDTIKSYLEKMARTR